jgi:hypothetical protein
MSFRVGLAAAKGALVGAPRFRGLAHAPTDPLQLLYFAMPPTPAYSAEIVAC